MSDRYRIAIDVGGTFTDAVAVDAAGRVHFAKAPSTPANQAEGVLEGLTRLAAQIGTTRAALLAQTERIVHGMTVATNALLERKGAKVGLLATEGHRDVLEMREGLKPERYDLRLPRREPLVPRHLRFGVRERMRADGRVETPLDAASLERAIAALRRARVESVAVCYLHAWRDDRHERATRAALEQALPGAFVCLSSEVLPQIKEYERTSTTVVNAAVGPLIRRYLGALAARLAEAGYRGPLLVMLSHGGVAPVDEAVRVAAATVLSGPAGGLAGAGRVAALLDVDDLIPFDMGGTSSDISLVVEGAAMLSGARDVAGERIALPSLDIITLGAGGGSIAHVDGGGLLKVGPQSAGADPGPACYARGGRAATVTDASVVLGYLDPERFLGGAARLDAQAAARALARLAEALGVDALRAAEGVHRVVNTTMAEAVRLATVRRGVDPRRFALLGFGGAAGLHVSALARLVGIGRVIVPRVASVLSAWGMLATALRTETTRSHVGDTGALEPGAIRDLYRAMAEEGRARMAGWFDGALESRFAADMRYGEQVFEIDVPLEGIDLDAPDLLARMKAAFEARHEALYTYALHEQDP
ncbi:MAG: hydantoinase/oxoprolinase family protein, partial [Burkholderiales bacterium]|nr:hydantoinase/oxoprolinase family protein [Burkholderiales bacterium]